MLKLKKVAVTGTLGSGKSTVCRIFQKLGAYVVDSDKIVHNLLSPETPLGKKIIKLLGPEIVANGHFDRKKMAKLVFENNTQLKALEEILHPQVYQEIDQVFAQVKKESKAPLFVAEVPLLFETHMETHFDYVVAVVADTEKCKTRLANIGFNSNDYERRMQRQLEANVKAKKADFILQNNGSMEDLEKEISLLFPELL